MTPRGETRTYRLEDQRGVVATMAEAGHFLGIGDRQVQNWLNKGCPGEKGRYVPADMVAWAIKYGPWKPDVTDGDPLMGGGASESPGLERYRLAKAEMAEWELAEKRGQLVRVEAVRELLTTFGSLFRSAGETLSRRFGRDAWKVVDEACDEAERLLESLPGGNRETVEVGEAES